MPPLYGQCLSRFLSHTCATTHHAIPSMTPRLNRRRYCIRRRAHAPRSLRKRGGAGFAAARISAQLKYGRAPCAPKTKKTCHQTSPFCYFSKCLLSFSCKCDCCACKNCKTADSSYALNTCVGRTLGGIGSSVYIACCGSFCITCAKTIYCKLNSK